MKKVFSIICILVLFGCVSAQNNQPTVDVSFKFQTSDGYTLDTFWRKRNSDGSVGELVSVGRSKFAMIMNSPSKLYEVDHKYLTSGDYYLVKYELNEGSQVITTDNVVWTAKGWDENGNPLLLKFTVKDNVQTLDLPETIAYLKQGENLTLQFKEENKILTIGKFVKIKK
ncbi:MAG: hypothetical protein ACI4N3_03315 [Alphaproteobacteria bacterium]